MMNDLNVHDNDDDDNRQNPTQIVCERNLNQLYKSSQDHCQPITHCLIHVW